MPKLIVRRTAGETYPIDIESSSTVLQLKAKIQAASEPNIEIRHQELYFEDEPMADEACLQDFLFDEGDIIVLNVVHSIILAILLDNGKRVTKSFPDGMRTTIKHLRYTAVQLFDGKGDCILSCYGVTLADTDNDGKDKTFGDYDLRTNRDVDVIFRINGGEMCKKNCRSL